MGWKTTRILHMATKEKHRPPLDNQPHQENVGNLLGICGSIATVKSSSTPNLLPLSENTLVSMILSEMNTLTHGTS
jgi:hypothetical protein